MIGMVRTREQTTVSSGGTEPGPDGDRGDALPGSRHLDLGQQAGGYGSGEGAGNLVRQEPGRV